MANTEPIATFKTHTCVEIHCNVCGYTLDEDDDGIRHFTSRAEAVEAAQHLGWTATPETVFDEGRAFAGYAICSTENAVHDGARHWLATRTAACGAQLSAERAERLGADPETRCARTPGHVEAGHVDATGNVMWLDPKTVAEVAK